VEYLPVVFWCIYKHTDYKVSTEAYSKISEFNVLSCLLGSNYVFKHAISIGNHMDSIAIWE